MLGDALSRLVARELDDIAALLERSHDMLQPALGQEPGFERLAALSQVLVSFYTGLERIFERLASRPASPRALDISAICHYY